MNPIPHTGPAVLELSAPARRSDERAPVLGVGDEAHLIRRAQHGDRQALEQLVDSHIRLVYKVARRYRCRTYQLDDLVQEGTLGLIQAVRRFDPKHGCRLSTYAMHWIRQAIARAIEQNDRLIHVPMHTHAEVRRVVGVRDGLQQTLGRTPTDVELAAAADLAEDRVVALMGIAQEPVSLEGGVGTEHEGCLLDLTEDPDAPNPERDVLSGLYHQQVRTFMADLRPREREVLEERFGFGGRSPRTLDDLSRSMHISRERVRQIETAAIRKLRRALSAANLD